jgi:hypothetical protein
MFVLVLNSKNLVQDGKNNKLVYKFPNSVQFKDKYVAITSISMFYSWDNISAVFNNNRFTYTWTAGAVTTTYEVLIPDGIYEIQDLNNYLQYVMISNNHYWITPAGLYVYPIELVINPNRYAVQLNTFLVPTALPVGYSVPAGFPGWPTVAQNPVVTFPSKFNEILGYTAGFVSNGNVNNAYVPPAPSVSNNYVSKSTAGTLSYLSNEAPQVQPNSSVLISMSNIQNPYTQPTSIIYSITPTVDIGEQIVTEPPNYMWNKLLDGTYNELRVTLLGTDLSELTLRDPNITILLAIKDKDSLY